MRHRAGLAAAIAAAALLLGAGGAPAQVPLVDPPAAARIVFAANGSLHTIAADGSGRARVTAGGNEIYDSDPAFSPAGDSIAFTRATGEDDGARVWLVRPDGSDVRPLLASPRPDRSDWSPAWSPDGSQLVFVRYREGSSRFTVSLVVAAADGSTQRTVFSESGEYDEDDGEATVTFIYSPAWSPDGQQILFTRSGEGLAGSDEPRPTLHVVPAAGGTPRLLARDAREGAWSPDGARIAFVTTRAGEACEGDCEFAGDIAVMNAEGAGRARLTDTRRPDDSEPTWSGDGERIVFHSDRNSLGRFSDEPHPELYSIRPDGSCMTWLTNGTAESRSPSFDPRPGLSSDPGACGPTDRQPLVETDTRKADAFRRFQLLWLGPVASPSGRLLTDADVSDTATLFVYDDCGRYEFRDCGEFLSLFAQDLCSDVDPLRHGGQRNSSLRIARGALVQVTRHRDYTGVDVYSHRTWLEIHAPRGSDWRPLVEALRRTGQPHVPGSAFPRARLPADLWRALARVTAAHRRLKDVDAVAKRLRVSRPEVKRRLTLARQLAKLGVERRLGCSR